MSADGPFVASNKLYKNPKKIQRAQNLNENANWLIQLWLLQLLQSKNSSKVELGPKHTRTLGEGRSKELHILAGYLTEQMANLPAPVSTTAVHFLNQKHTCIHIIIILLIILLLKPF